MEMFVDFSGLTSGSSAFDARASHGSDTPTALRVGTGTSFSGYLPLIGRNCAGSRV